MAPIGAVGADGGAGGGGEGAAAVDPLPQRGRGPRHEGEPALAVPPQAQRLGLCAEGGEGGGWSALEANRTKKREVQAWVGPRWGVYISNSNHTGVRQTN